MRARDDLAGNDTQAYGEWLEAEWETDRANYGDDAAKHTNCRWGITGTEEPLFVDTATNVYGRGVLTTHVRERGQCLEVTREFRPFAAPS
jgi:hypothetical protein